MSCNYLKQERERKLYSGQEYWLWQ